MQEIYIPQELLDEYNKSAKQEASWMFTNRRTFEKIKALNYHFMIACRKRINRKLTRIDRSLDIHMCHHGNEIWIDAELTVYLHGRNTARLSCRLTKTNDSDAMIELAKKIYELRVE